MKIHDKRPGSLDALLATSQYHKQEIHLRLTLNTTKFHCTHGKLTTTTTPSEGQILVYFALR